MRPAKYHTKKRALPFTLSSLHTVLMFKAVSKLTGNGICRGVEPYAPASFTSHLFSYNPNPVNIKYLPGNLNVPSAYVTARLALFDKGRSAKNLCNIMVRNRVLGC